MGRVSLFPLLHPPSLAASVPLPHLEQTRGRTHGHCSRYTALCWARGWWCTFTLAAVCSCRHAARLAQAPSILQSAVLEGSKRDRQGLVGGGRKPSRRQRAQVVEEGYRLVVVRRQVLHLLQCHFQVGGVNVVGRHSNRGPQVLHCVGGSRGHEQHLPCLQNAVPGLGKARGGCARPRGASTWQRITPAVISTTDHTAYATHTISTISTANAVSTADHTANATNTTNAISTANATHATHVTNATANITNAADPIANAISTTNATHATNATANVTITANPIVNASTTATAVT